MEDIITDSQIHGHSLRRILLYILLFIFTLFSFSQSGLSTQSKKAKKLYEKADKKYKERDFQTALGLLEEAANEDPLFFEAYIRMGSLYNAMGQVDSVYSKFQAYVKTANDPIASVLEKLAFMAFDRGEYGKSRSFVNAFLEKVPERRSGGDIKLLLESLEFAQNEIKNFSDSLKIEELPKEINRFKLQYLPSITVDNSTMFYTKRDFVQGDEDIVVSYYRDGKWSAAESVSPRINTSLNEGACAVSADGRTMIFTSCDGRNSLGSCDLYISKKTGDVWSRPKNLGKPVNSRYWESQPSLSADGNTLYFSSNRVGGYGGRDIWVSKKVDEDWGEPVNLGPSINTPKDETTPFIHPNGTSLYFSANGYIGLGGYDLYVSKHDSSWSVPENLGFPINTHKDEVAIVIGSDGRTAFYAKEEQKNFEILDSRIVSFKVPKEKQTESVTYIIGRVIDSKNSNPLRAEVQVVNMETNETIYENSSDSISGEYLMVLPLGLELAAYVKKRGYLFADYTFTTNENSLANPDTIEIALQPIQVGEKMILKNIYFDVDSYMLDQKSKSEIENVAQLLHQNPRIIVEISGHTDDTGSKVYNQNLSEKRAESVYNELIEMGCAKDQLLFKGYADSQPLLPNTSNFNRQSNRRIEFRVIRTKQ
ncbi:OmpA family protein [Ekhidna sp.]|uniref:OmpA family protein n=1 Tax=Ekhidna sp. TaxID=2608089 RepID=UPI003518FD46